MSTDTRLHLIEPLGYSLDNKYVKRSGMDYWNHLDYTIYKDWQDFLDQNPDAVLYFLSTKGKKVFWECPFEKESFLVFGSEGSGLPQSFHQKYRDRIYTIPMPGKFHRSFNLANSVAITLFEGMRRDYCSQPG